MGVKGGNTVPTDPKGKGKPNNSTNSNGTGYPSSGGGYSGGGGSGGGGGGGGPSKKQRQAAKNLGAIAGYNAGTIKKGLDKQNKIYDISDKQNQRLRDRDLTIAGQGASDDWFARQQQLQAATHNIIDRAGNAMNGSAMYDIWDTLQKVDDMGDVEVLKTLGDNKNQAYGNFFEAMSQTNNARNAALLEAWKGLRTGESDQAAQLNNIDASLFQQPGTGKSGKKGSKKYSKGDTIVGTDWGSSSFWKNNPFFKALKPQRQGFFRGDGDSPASMTTPGRGGSNTEYWKSMGGGYDNSR